MWDRALRRRVIAVLAQLPAFGTPEDARDFTRLALGDLKYGQRLVNLINWDGAPRRRALRLVLDAQEYRSPEGVSYLVFVLEEALLEASPDQIHILNEALEALRAPVNHAPGTDPRIPASPLARYCQSRIEAWRHKPFQLHERFVRLTLELPTQGPQPDVKTFEDLQTLIKAAHPAPAVLLEGDPGAGKSTLLRHLDQVLAQTHLDDPQAPVPFFVPLNLYETTENQSLAQWLEVQWARRDRDAPPLTDLLQDGRVWLLLDGLNEMAFEASDRFSSFGKYLAQLPPGNRAVLTCRSRDIVGTIGPLPKATVKPLGDDRIREFLEKHVPKATVSKVWAAMGKDDTLDLYRNPYLLHLLVQQLDEDGEVPTDRAALFERFVAQALQRELAVQGPRARLEAFLRPRDIRCIEQDARLPHPAESASPHLLAALGRLAFDLQMTSPGAWLSRPVHEMFAFLHPDEREADRMYEAALSLQVLTENDRDEAQFTHQLVQEYFAARHWLVVGGFERARRPYRNDDPDLHHLDHGPLEALVSHLKPSESMPERKASGWEESARMAASMARGDDFLRGLMEYDLITAAQCGLGPGSGSSVLASDRLQTELRKKLGAWMRDPEVELRARIDAGGTLDDPRAFDSGFIEGKSPDGHRYLLPPLVQIPTGSYIIGSNEHDDDEKPEHPWSLEQDIWLAKYPVTNAEFRCFMNAGGYDDNRWWPDGTEGRRWRDGEREDTETEDYVRWLRSISEEELAELSDRYGLDENVRRYNQTLRTLPLEEAIAKHRPATPPGLLRRPHFWFDNQYNAPLQPVVGVCLFEAEAYLRWLGHCCGVSFHIPHEKEWEAAARGPQGRMWASGNKVAALTINTLETRLRRPSPIGIFHESLTLKTNLSDLSGNVWEWTASSKTASHHPGAKQETTSRIVRGGSWNDPVALARCACRSWYPPDRRGGSLGFRMLSPSPVPDPLNPV